MTELVLRAEGLHKSFVLHLQGGVRIPVLRDLALEIHAGECVVLVGRSGAGKSTLMRSLYGNYRTNDGRILIRHQGALIDLVAAEPRTVLAIRRVTLGYVSQFLRVVPRVSALSIVTEALTAIGTELEEAESRARALLLRLNIPVQLHSLPPATFSGGEQQRVNLARGFIGRHPILLLDEPTASLDPANRDVVIGMIHEAKRSGIAVLAIMHDITARDAVADRLFAVPALQDAA